LSLDIDRVYKVDARAQGTDVGVGILNIRTGTEMVVVNTIYDATNALFIDTKHGHSFLEGQTESAQQCEAATHGK
jgi:hypothetical protein